MCVRKKQQPIEIDSLFTSKIFFSKAVCLPTFYKIKSIELFIRRRIHLIQLISDHGSTISTGFFQTNQAVTSLSKCLRYIKNIIKLDASMSKFDTNSACYKLLTDMSVQKDFVEFRGRIYLPVKSQNQSVWGFIEINCFNEKPTSVQIKKAVRAAKDILEANLDTREDVNNKIKSNYSVLMLESSFEKSHRASTNVFQDDKFTAFINLSEWISQKQPFSLSSLREFSDSLLFVPEILSLSATQRAVLALFALLPHELKKSSLILCTKANDTELMSQLADESNFLSAFSDKKTVQEDSLHTIISN